MIRVSELTEMKIPAEVKEWVQKNTGSHVTLARFWQNNPDSPFKTDYNTVVTALAAVVQKETPNKNVAERLLGRARVLAKEEEKKDYDAFFGIETEEVLDCLM